MRIAVVGKGGAGKSTLAGTLARVLARRGHEVLALDSDPMPGLALSLGVEEPAEPPLNEAAERDERGRWRLKKGIGPARAVERFVTPAPDGVRLLQIGKAGPDGLVPINGSLHAFYQVIHRLPEAKSLRETTIVGDLSAGPRQIAFDWAPYADTFLLVVEPSWKSVLTASRIACIARSRARGPAVLAVANKVTGPGGAAEIESRLGERVFAEVPADPALRQAERAGLAPLDHTPDGPAVRAIERLAARLEARSLQA